MANERRRKQIARRVQARLAQILLYEMKDPRASFLTITEVEMNRDLSIARVRWSTLDPSARSRIAHMLEHAHGFLRREVAQEVQLRSAPQVVFEYDERIERADRIESILRDLRPKDD